MGADAAPTTETPATPPEQPKDTQTSIYAPEFVASVAKEIVFDETGHGVAFGDLVKQSPTVAVIFSCVGSRSLCEADIPLAVRHFYCGLCQDYVRDLGKAAPVDALKAKDISVVVIGQGSYSLIKPYRETFKSSYAFYAQPTKSLYKKFGMTRKLASSGDHRGSYVKQSAFMGALTGIKRALSMGKIAPFGDISQNGGEQIWRDGTCIWAHNMSTSTDHAEVAEVLSKAGF